MCIRDRDTIDGIGVIYCGKGNNTITTQSTAIIYCGEGNNNIVETVNGNAFIYGGSGVNNINITGDINYIEAGSGTMNITISSNAKSNGIYSVSYTHLYIYRYFIKT